MSRATCSRAFASQGTQCTKLPLRKSKVAGVIIVTTLNWLMSYGVLMFLLLHDLHGKSWRRPFEGVRVREMSGAFSVASSASQPRHVPPRLTLTSIDFHINWLILCIFLSSTLHYFFTSVRIFQSSISFHCLPWSSQQYMVDGILLIFFHPSQKSVSEDSICTATGSSE